MEAETLFKLLCVAASAKTPEDQARVAWRFSDAMWRAMPFGGVSLRDARSFNDFLQDLNLPWVTELWSKEEAEEFRAEFETLVAASPK